MSCWQNGYARGCNPRYTGSIPVQDSKIKEFVCCAKSLSVREVLRRDQRAAELGYTQSYNGAVAERICAALQKLTTLVKVQPAPPL